ncbi:MAG TPA: hypothetical protein VII99_06410, partial [Bacteroidia bacterium]
MRRFLYHPKFRRTVFFFPFQLLFLHIKKNILLLSVVGLLLGFITQVLAPRYGVPYLFLNPEYFGEVGPLSYFIVGVSFGAFIMAFNTASYILNSFRFPFLATLSQPFTKYCLNNFIIPGILVVVYLWNIIDFLKGEQLYSRWEMFQMVGAFIGGILLFAFITLLYFAKTNKNIHKMFGVKPQDLGKDELLLKRYSKGNEAWKNPYLIRESRDWYVETYLSSPFRLRLVRAVRHYKREMLRNVFKQNYRNAGVFTTISILVLLMLGIFREVSFLMIPAGASVILLLIMIIMLPIPLYTLFRGWAPIIFVG